MLAQAAVWHQVPGLGPFRYVGSSSRVPCDRTWALLPSGASPSQS